MTISLGRFKFSGKSHTQDAKGVDTFRMKFEDENKNKLSFKCDESDFEQYSEDDYYDLDAALRQRTLQ